MTRDTHSTVQCDSEGCASRITVNHDITETQAAAAARALGWACTKGTARWQHHCPLHPTACDTPPAPTSSASTVKP